jgi:hypothetical protein
MAFLAPWFLLGMFAVAGPVIAHLRRLSVQNRVAFSAVELLEPRPPRSARRNWEDRALMAARILALSLLSLVFSRPYLPGWGLDSGLKNDERRLVVLIDTSASMRRGKVFEEARRGVLEKVRLGVAPSAVEIRTFDRSVRTVLSFAQWQQTPHLEREALLRQTLSSLEPGWATGRLDEALRTLAEQHLAGETGGSTEVLLVSDLQEGSSIAGLQGYEWPKRFSVTVCNVGAGEPSSVALRWLPPDPDTTPSDAPCRLQIITPPDFRGETVKLLMEGTVQSQSSFAVTSGKSKVVSLPHASSFNRVRADGHDDFAAAIWVSRVPQNRALVVIADESGGGAAGGEDKTAAAYFVRNALQALGQARVEICDGATLPVGRDPEVTLWVVCGNTSQPLRERIRSSVEHGATALVLLASEREAPGLSALGGIPITAKEKEERDGSFAALGAIEREHPLFAPFLSPQFSDFTGIRFWKHRVLELPSEAALRVLARFEGGDPALVEIRRGQGRVFAWASGWKASDGQWVLSSRCVPFLASCVDLAGGGRRPLLTAAPGERVALPGGITGVRSEGGEVMPVSGGFVELDRPGVYQLEPGGGTVVVNIAPEEASFASLPDGKLDALGVPVNRSPGAAVSGVSAVPGSETLAPVDLEAKQGGWRFVLATVLALLAVETVWAARITQRGKGLT